MPLVQYREFNKACSEDYPLIEGKAEYAANEYVSPAVICCMDGEVFRTPRLYWFPWSDFCLAKEIREMEANPVRFPFRVRYDGYNELMKKLFNFVGVSYLKKVPKQLCLYRVAGKDIDELGHEY